MNNKGKRLALLLDNFRPTSHILNVFFNAVCLFLLKNCIRPVCSFAVPHSWPSVLLCSERMGPLSWTPSTVGCSPPPVPRAGYAPSTLLLLDTQPRSYSIRVWLYETLIVTKTVIDRYLVFKTWAAVGRVHFTPPQPREPRREPFSPGQPPGDFARPAAVPATATALPTRNCQAPARLDL